MADGTSIEWTATIRPDGSTTKGATFNPWVGCTKVSPACDHCYAEGWAKRTGHPELWSGTRRRTTAAYWQQPIKWNREAAATGTRKRVFCASLADVFDNQVPAEWRRDLWDIIDRTQSLDWLLLTKRPQNAARMIIEARRGLFRSDIDERHVSWPWPNVWIGTTVENQEEADRRIPHLLAVPAIVRFLSCEPLLGPVDLHLFHGSLRNRTGLNWVIAGGESGPGARPMHPDWVRSLRDQCVAAGVPFFFKQWGEWIGTYPADRKPAVYSACREWNGGICAWRVGKKSAGATLDGRAWREFPNA